MADDSTTDPATTANPVASAPASTPAPAAPTKAQERSRPPEMHFGSYPLFIMFWPLVVGGEICAWLIHWNKDWAESTTWVYITILLTCCVTTGFDVRRNLAIGWGLFVALCWVGGIYLRDTKHIPVLSDIKSFLANFNATVSPGFLHSVSLMILVGLIGVIANVFLNHRWRMTHNELHLFRHGEGEDAITRGAKRISVEFPDVFELLLLGAGHVVVRDSKGREEIRRIPRVPLLVFREKELDRIAEVWAVTTQNEASATEEEEG